MALLERINQMKQRGISDPQIIRNLQQEGNSYKDINDAFSQMNIKSAISQPAENFNSESQGEEDMQPSIMASSNAQSMAPFSSENQLPYKRQAQQMPTQAPASAYVPPQNETEGYTQQYPQEPIQQESNQGQYNQQEYNQAVYDQENQSYAPAQETYYQQAMDIETVREISRQVVEAELSKTKIEVAEIIKMKTELNFQVQSMDNRLTKIENTMQELQTAILKKIGSYGEAITNISKDLRETQDSFSKMINPILDIKRGKMPQQQSQQPPSAQQARRTKFQTNQQINQQVNQQKGSESSESASFEDYFR